MFNLIHTFYAWGQISTVGFFFFPLLSFSSLNEIDVFFFFGGRKWDWIGIVLYVIAPWQFPSETWSDPPWIAAVRPCHVLYPISFTNTGWFFFLLDLWNNGDEFIITCNPIFYLQSEQKILALVIKSTYKFNYTVPLLSTYDLKGLYYCFQWQSLIVIQSIQPLPVKERLMSKSVAYITLFSFG